MGYRILDRDEHFRNDGSPKRILALDGGGLRGVVTLGFLARMEELLRQRHGGTDRFRLCHYFDLIAGTSTGAIIAAALALGWRVEDIHREYMSLGRRVFERSFFRQGFVRAKYDEKRLSDELRRVYGEDTVLGGAELQTGLLVVTKRLDTGSPWPIGNNPRGRFFEGDSKGRLGNGSYPLWQIVRASTAAPSYFEPECITVSEREGAESVAGNFVDGGVSPFNNPGLQALMYATLNGYNVGWPTGADKLLLVSVGTGTADPSVAKASLAAGHAVGALLSLMEDCASLQQTLLQWMSSSTTARVIDRDVGDLRHDLLTGAPLISYLRYDLELNREAIQALDSRLTDLDRIRSLSEMDAPENMEILHEVGLRAGERDVDLADFASIFDLPRV
ncbi:patatin-like phospholipase family protein [Aromatoleum toluclasticum]|uniref:patatin-like phospholipase family protein n=1 Tax=Aromatoleum toluclasticum TaxID=92003 RepID=UPI001D1891CA|nr:patatin-like phospholipase family protein [Aromatoleum toluclasticum]MCC4113889.1 patatin-like phospholipase family protein [Aromatoleum toluclasticum]